MEYCPKCGGLMLPRRGEGRVILRCARCGYEKEVSDRASYRITRRVRHGPRDAIVVVDKGIKVEVLPKTRVLCPRCGYTEAYYWEMQTRSGDEPATRFFKCVKCGHVWREYQ